MCDWVTRILIFLKNNKARSMLKNQLRPIMICVSLVIVGFSGKPERLTHYAADPGGRHIDQATDRDEIINRLSSLAFLN